MSRRGGRARSVGRAAPRIPSVGRLLSRSGRVNPVIIHMRALHFEPIWLATRGPDPEPIIEHDDVAEDDYSEDSAP